MSKDATEDAFLFFIAIPLIVIIVYYLIACTIAPIFELNNQTFKILFTLAGGAPTLLFYFKNKLNKQQHNDIIAIKT